MHLSLPCTRCAVTLRPPSFPSPAFLCTSQPRAGFVLFSLTPTPASCVPNPNLETLSTSFLRLHTAKETRRDFHDKLRRRIVSSLAKRARQSEPDDRTAAGIHALAVPLAETNHATLPQTCHPPNNSPSGPTVLFSFPVTLVSGTAGSSPSLHTPAPLSVSQSLSQPSSDRQTNEGSIGRRVSPSTRGLIKPVLIRGPRQFIDFANLGCSNRQANHAPDSV